MKITPILGLLALGASSAFAGSSTMSKGTTATYTDPAPQYNWTGFYLGVQAGVVFNPDTDGGLAFDTDRNGSYNNEIAAFGNNFSHEFDESISGGVHAGYDVQINNFVVGLVLDYNRTDITEDQNGFSSTPAFYTDRRELENLATFRLRGGVLATDRCLIYLTGGLAYGDPSYSFVTDTPATVRSRGEGNDFGYTVGAGIETRITEHVSLSLEYLFTDFGDGDFTTNLSGPDAFSGVSGSTDSRGSDDNFDFHSLNVKLTYRF